MKELQLQQLHSGIVQDDRVIGIYASDAAYPDDALIRLETFNEFETYNAEPMDISSSEDENDDDDIEVDEEEKEQIEPNEDDIEHNQSDEQIEYPNVEQDSEVKQNSEVEKDSEIEQNDSDVEVEQISKTTKKRNCTSRCKGTCSGCVCKRILKQKCTSACGCGEKCKNK